MLAVSYWPLAFGFSLNYKLSTLNLIVGEYVRQRYTFIFENEAEKK